MGLLRKLFGPSFKELAERDLERLKESQKVDSMPKQESLQEKLDNYEPPVIRPPKKIGEYILNKKYVYKYVELKVVPDNILFNFDFIGKELGLIPDPDNEYDPLAIKVYVDDIFIGYIPKNRLQSMIHDYNKSGNPIYSVISNIGIKDDTELIEDISIFLCFYYNPLKDLDDDDKIFTKLIKTSKKDSFDINRQDNYSDVYIGEFVDLEYDFDSDSYIVSIDGSELGETNALVTKKLLDYDSSCDYIGVIDEIIENYETGKYGAKITIIMK